MNRQSLNPMTTYMTVFMLVILLAASIRSDFSNNLLLVGSMKILLSSEKEFSHLITIASNETHIDNGCRTPTIIKGLLLEHIDSKNAGAYWRSSLRLCTSNQFVALKAGDYAFASEQYDLAAEAWSQSSGSLDYLLTRTETAAKNGDWETTQSLANLLVQLSADNPWGFYYRGLAGLQTGDWPSSADDFEYALTLTDPKNISNSDRSDMYQLLGRAYRYLGDYAPAKAALSQAISINAHNSTAYVDMAILERDRDHDLALSYARNAIEADSKDIWAYLTLGDMEMQFGSLLNAAHLAELAIALQPDSPHPYLLASQISVAMEDTESAFAYIDVGLKSSSSVIDLLCYRLQLASDLDDGIQIAQTDTMFGRHQMVASMCTH